MQARPPTYCSAADSSSAPHATAPPPLTHRQPVPHTQARPPGAPCRSRGRVGVRGGGTMGRVEFYALWSVLEAPRQMISKGSRMGFQLPLPLPLPKQLLLFSLGDWTSYTRDTVVTAQLSTGSGQPQHIGKLSSGCRSLVWEGEWSLDIVMDCVKLAAQGIPAKLFLIVTGKVMKGSGFSSSTPARKRLSVGPPSSPLLSESTIAHVRILEAPREEKDHSAEGPQLATSAILKDSPPLKKAALNLPPILKEAAAGGQDPYRRANVIPRNPRRLRFGSKGSEDGTPGAVYPSARWWQSVCLCDPDTAVLIGGEGANEKPCRDSLWKLEIDSDFWFQMDSLCSGSAPQCSRGHTATFDPETKKVFVYGGMRESRWFSNVYMLDTLDWKWTLVTAVGKVPTLSYHSATMYQRELYVFGGLCPQTGTDSGSSTNSLYIFNPEYKIWYQPIVEGERPLPRFGHSSTLLGNRLVLFGGRRSPSTVYLNDVHILDLGYMEYTAVSLSPSTEKPSPRCFHAAMQLSEHKLLIHGGCSGTGALRDAFIFNLDTASWSSVTFGASSQLPRAGHSLLNLTSSHLTDSDKEKRGKRSMCRVLIIGGSDGAGNFYSDTPKFKLDVGT
ncbi:uncharacterized protein LOC134981093 isoform X2 [Pseudophryne corroboree]|uniref:uncharacterized protein LOC134981093 isoform X2 n=1 Tax=Pseudophryne corroboree TaxID=495146 RepID=UPI0030821A04